MIDAHQHFWRVDRGDYGWLTPALGPIHRDFMPDDLAPLLARHGIDGTILVQGWGQFGKHQVETPSLIRYGQMTSDELFVSADRAKAGISITNKSATENMVFLKHFGPGNPQAPIGR